MVDPGLVYGTWALVGVTGLFAWRQIVNQQDAERVRMTVNRRDRYESEEIQRYRRALAEQLYSRPREKPLAHFDPAVPNFFDVTGSLLRKGFLARDLIREFFGYGAKRYYRALEATLDQDSNRNPNDNLWHDFRYLVDQLGGSSPTEDEMRNFLVEEMNLQPQRLAID